MITTPEIICDLFSFLDKDQIERIQLVNRLWNNVVIRHTNILPLRQLYQIAFRPNEIDLYVTEEDFFKNPYIINFDGTNLNKIETNASSQYSQLTVDEVLTNLNGVIIDTILFDCNLEDRLDKLLNLMKFVTTKTGDRFRGKFGSCNAQRFDSKVDEIFNNYIIVDELTLGDSIDYIRNSYIREICANPEIVQWPSTPKEIRLSLLEFKENEEVLHFTCNGKLNGANRVTIVLYTSYTNYENFIRQWFELYRTHQDPISLVGKFELFTSDYNRECVLAAKIIFNAVKTFLHSTQLRVKYSLETKEFHISFYLVTKHYLNRRCVVHGTDSYALVIDMAYEVETDISSINASDLDQPPCDTMKIISCCVKSL